MKSSTLFIYIVIKDKRGPILVNWDFCGDFSFLMPQLIVLTFCLMFGMGFIWDLKAVQLCSFIHDSSEMSIGFCFCHS